MLIKSQWYKWFLTFFIVFLNVCIALTTYSANTKTIDLKITNDNSYRIITLSPHLTELVFALGHGDNIVAVSDYSDYPEKARLLPSIASYQGANIGEIIRLKPTHVLVWKGGNKDSDIQRLKQNEYMLYESNINDIDDLKRNIQEIGRFLNAEASAADLIEHIERKLAKNVIDRPYINSIYYISNQPLVGLGNDKWINDLLSVCNINNLYKISNSAYPQLNKADIIRKQPKLIISATNQSLEQSQEFWKPHQSQLHSLIVKVDPDAIHRFTPRAIDETLKLCQKVNQSK